MQHDHHVYTFYLFILRCAHVETTDFDISTEARDGWTYQVAYR